MSYCTCYCCQGHGCSRQYIGYFDTYVSNCLSSTCTQVFPNKCIRDVNLGGSISAQFTSYPPQIPNQPLPPSKQHNVLIIFFLGLFSIILLVALIYWCCDNYIQRKRRYRYQQIQENIQSRSQVNLFASPPPEENSSQPYISFAPPPYSKNLPQQLPKKQKPKKSQSRYNDPIYIPVPIVHEPIYHPPRHNTPIHIDTYTVTSSTQDHSYTYCDDGYGDVSQTDTDNF